MLVIGLMSGTSADGIDAALVEWPDGPEVRPFRLLAYREAPHPPELRARIHALADGETAPGETVRELARLDVALGEAFAVAARAVAEEAGVPAEAVHAVASHGQTVGHYPEDRATVQIGDPSVIAERTGWVTVADFRTRDVAAGGQGAPLAPFFHHAALSDPAESRVVLNLGGIANVTWLPAGGRADDVVAFDTGPANSLLDECVSLATGGAERVDRDGARAANGQVDEALLAELLDDAYFRREPPKSTGRERYGRAEAERIFGIAQDRKLAVEDLLATLVALTAETVAGACRTLGPPARVLVAGGGGKNPSVLAALAERLPGVALDPLEAHGVPSEAAEAMAFSLMGRNTLLGVPNHLPRTTGARAARVLGEVVRP